MDHSQFMKIDKQQYLHIARALVVYDHVTHRNAERKSGKGNDVSELQEQWLAEAERFGAVLSEEEREAVLDDAMDAMDDFVEAETWQEVAWWIAEREYKRMSVEKDDAEARDLVMDRIYHEVMEEFMKHGVERLSLPGIPRDTLSPRRVADALKHLRSQTRGIAKRS